MDEHRGCKGGLLSPLLGFLGASPYAVGDPDMSEPFVRLQIFPSGKRAITNGVKSVASRHWLYVSDVSGNCIELGACSQCRIDMKHGGERS